MSTAAALKPTTEELAEAIGWPSDGWGGHCHEVSLAIVRARVFPVARVARGSGRGVSSQHSWIVLGDDCYGDPYEHGTDVEVCDPTIGFWPGTGVERGVWYGTYADDIHHPQQAGHIMQFGRPPNAEENGEDPYYPPGWDTLSGEARRFIGFIGEPSMRTWHELVHYPMQGWPSREIVAMVCDDPKLRGLVPIDIEGMLTDHNPNRLYLPEEE